MGSGYELKCEKCEFKHIVCEGIGFLYPSLCAEILDKMKKGAYGKGFMEDALRIDGVAVHHECMIFVCDHCGKWRADEVIDLCAPIGDPVKPTRKFCSAMPDPQEKLYVMGYEIKKEYSIVRSKRHMCGNCRHKLRQIKKNEKLNCPHCGSQLIKCNEFFWD